MVRDWFLAAAAATLVAVTIIELAVGDAVSTRNIGILITYFVMDSAVFVHAIRQWLNDRESLYKWVFVVFVIFVVADTYNLLFVLTA